MERENEMRTISEKSMSIGRSPIRKTTEKVGRMTDVVNFAIGEPDFDTPRNVVEAAIDALNRGETHYTPNKGIQPLRKALADNYAREGISYDFENEIMVTSGGMEALYLINLTILDPGDEVIVSNPCFPNHIQQIRCNGGVPVPVPVFEEDGFTYNIDNLRKAVTERTKMILLNSPANPTGGVASRKVLEQIADLAIEKNLWVLSDEVYINFSYAGKALSIASLENMKERTIVVNSFSKAYAMTGWRVGYAAGPREVIGTMVKLQENISGCVNTAAQFAAIEAISGSQAQLDFMREQYRARRDRLVSGLNAIDGISCIEPLGAFYAFPNITKTGLSSEEFADRLLEEKKVAVVPGPGFGSAGEGFVRLCYAVSGETIDEGLKRIREFAGTL